VGEVRGEVEKAEDGVLIIKHIHIGHKLTVSDQERPTAERVHVIYADRCLSYRSVKEVVTVTTSLTLVAE
jgi:uncharacterized OsmC-like protein